MHINIVSDMRRCFLLNVSLFFAFTLVLSPAVGSSFFCSSSSSFIWYLSAFFSSLPRFSYSTYPCPFILPAFKLIHVSESSVTLWWWHLNQWPVIACKCCECISYHSFFLPLAPFFQSHWSSFASFSIPSCVFLFILLLLLLLSLLCCVRVSLSLD